MFKKKLITINPINKNVLVLDYICQLQNKHSESYKLD